MIKIIKIALKNKKELFDVSNILENKFAISWKDVQILNDINGRPYIDILNEKIKNQITQIDISISHCKEYAVSTVIINY